MKSTNNAVILKTDLAGIERHGSGKVRDVYRVDGKLLIVATDRISAFDYILPTGIPDKGRVLTQLSIFWFDFLRDLTPTHFLTADVGEYPEALSRFSDQLEGRSMLVKRANMIEIECVARGYISGSGERATPLPCRSHPGGGEALLPSLVDGASAWKCETPPRGVSSRRRSSSGRRTVTWTPGWPS